MNEVFTHNIEIKITSNYLHGEKQYAIVSLTGDGGLDHMIEAFKTALVVAGFSLDTVKRLETL
jgi:hypothetical protein